MYNSNGVAINIDDDSYLVELEDIRKKEQEFVKRLIEERRFLGENFRIDFLTGLYNRKIMPKIREIGSVVLCDVDDFKTINDTYGHPVGDVALRTLGEIILNHIRIGDVGIRYGGDEMMIVFTMSDREVITRRMTEISNAYKEALKSIGLDSSLSVGVVINSDHEKLEPLIEKADEAVYFSKQNGKDQINFFDQLGKEKTKKEGLN